MKPEQMLELETQMQQEGVCSEILSDLERLDVLWRLFVEKNNSVRMLTQELEELRAKHAAELNGVQKYIQSIRSLSKTWESTALELERENKKLLSDLVAINQQQEALKSEIAKMVREGLDETMTSSLSEQVAYLLADRAALLKKIQALEDADLKTVNITCTRKQKTSEKVATRRCFKKLLGCRKAAQAKPDGNRAKESKDKKHHLSEIDLEEASATLNQAQKEIQRLRSELESASLKTSTYKSELHVAQVEAERLRNEVEKLKRCDLAKAEKMNKVLDAEIRHLRDSGQSMCAQVLELLDRNFKDLDSEDEEFVRALTQKLAPEMVLRRKVEESDKRRRTRRRRKKEAEQPVLELQDTKVQHVHPESNQDVLKTKLHEQETLKLSQDIVKLEEVRENLQLKLQQVRCSLHSHVRKYDEMKMHYREKLAQAKQVYIREMTWRNEKIKERQGELDLLAKRLKNESDMVKTVTAENEALLLSKKALLCQLNKAEENRNHAETRASALLLRVNFLEKDSMEQWEKNMAKSSQITKLERRLWNAESPKNSRKHHWNPILKGASCSERGFQSSIRKRTDGQMEIRELSAPPSLRASSEMGYMNTFTHSLG